LTHCNQRCLRSVGEQISGALADAQANRQTKKAEVAARAEEKKTKEAAQAAKMKKKNKDGAADLDALLSAGLPKKKGAK